MICLCSAFTACVPRTHLGLYSLVLCAHCDVCLWHVRCCVTFVHCCCFALTLCQHEVRTLPNSNSWYFHTCKNQSLHGVRTSVPVCQPVTYCIVCCVRLASCGVESSVLFVCSMCLLLAPRPKRHWVSWHWVSWHWVPVKRGCWALLYTTLHSICAPISHELLRSVLMNCGSEVICKDHVTVSRCNVAASHSRALCALASSLWNGF